MIPAVNVTTKDIPGTNADEDGNGWIDDTFGWDFQAGLDVLWEPNQPIGDSDPSPSLNNGIDNEHHGTMCAGAAAARGFNGIGMAGAAPLANLFFVRVGYNGNALGARNAMYTTSSRLANGVRYAAGRMASGAYQDGGGADVLSMSLTLANPLQTVYTAIDDAATLGRVRNGVARGAVLIAAANNHGSGWEDKTYLVKDAGESSLVPGNYTFRWTFSKDANDTNNINDDCVWLDDVRIPGQPNFDMQNPTLPSGWSTSPAPYNWFNVPNSGGNHGVVGTSGENAARSFRSGPITHNGSTWIETTVNLTSVNDNLSFAFHCWISTEAFKDLFKVTIKRPETPNGPQTIERAFDVGSGRYDVHSYIDFPASHLKAIAVGACTQNQFRADYSQYNPTPTGKTVDFLAPAYFPTLRGVNGTDRTDLAGYTPSNYLENGSGTSISTPLVAGVAALLLSHRPTLSPEDVRAHLRANCVKIGDVPYSGLDEASRNQEYGSGRLDAHLALAQGARDTTLTGRNLASGPNGSIYMVDQLIEAGRTSKIFVAGSFTFFDGVSRPGIARLDSTGVLDTAFAPSVASQGMTAIAVQPDKKVIVSGFFPGQIARLNTDGSLDTTFSQTLNGQAYCIRLRADGKIWIGGNFTTVSTNSVQANRIALLNPNGSLDTSFSPFYGANGTVYAMLPYTDGGILVGGDFTYAGGSPRNRLGKLTAAGGSDPYFNPGLGFDGPVYALTAQSSGRIIVGGAFLLFNGNIRSRITALTSTGSLDTGFVDFGGANAPVRTLIALNDDRVIVGGSFTTIQGGIRSCLARLKTTGANDPYFDPGSGANSTVESVIVQPNNKILLGGAFSLYNSHAHNKLSRVHGK